MVNAIDPTTKEMSAQDVCKVLQPMFEHRSVSLSLLNYYKRTGTIEPTGKGDLAPWRSRLYSFFDVVALAAVLELTDRGLVCRLMGDIITGIQSGIINELIEQRSGNLLVRYDPAEIAEEVRNHWNAFIEEQGAA